MNNRLVLTTCGSEFLRSHLWNHYTKERYRLASLKTSSLSANTLFLLGSTSEAYCDPLVNLQKEDDWRNINPTGFRVVYIEARRFTEAI